MRNRISRPKLSESWGWFVLLDAFLLALWMTFTSVILYEHLPFLSARIIMLIGCVMIAFFVGYVMGTCTDG